MSSLPLSDLRVSDQWQADFLAVLPAVRTHANIQFRSLRPDRREEAVQEAMVSAAVSYRLLACQGKLHTVRPSALADFAVKHVRSGRQVGGHQNSQDVLSPLAQQKRGFRVHRLNPRREDQAAWQAVLLTENPRVRPADQAAFRLDFNEWLANFSRRDRRIIAMLASGERTSAVAQRFGLTAGRISQLRRRFELEWRGFQGELSERPRMN